MGNNEIKISGGSITTNTLVVGDHAKVMLDHQSVILNQNDVKEISKLIDELILKLKTTTETIGSKSDIISAVETLKTEVNKEKPSQITLKSVGKTIFESLQYVKDIAPFIHTIWDKIAALTL